MAGPAVAGGAAGALQVFVPEVDGSRPFVAADLGLALGDPAEVVAEEVGDHREEQGVVECGLRAVDQVRLQGPLRFPDHVAVRREDPGAAPERVFLGEPLGESQHRDAVHLVRVTRHQQRIGADHDRGAAVPVIEPLPDPGPREGVEPLTDPLGHVLHEPSEPEKLRVEPPQLGVREGDPRRVARPHPAGPRALDIIRHGRGISRRVGIRLGESRTVRGIPSRSRTGF